MTREMKDSGIEWIGEIPEEWEIVKIGSQYIERKTKVSDTEYAPLSVTMKGVLPQLATAAKTDAHDDRKLVCKGDFAINSRSDRRGSCGISPCEGSVSLINTILQPRNKMDPKYYDWLFHSTMFSDEFYSWGHGIVDDLWTTGWQDMKRIMIPEPCLEEQGNIAAFLDRKCAEIDRITVETEKTIEEYKTLKQSVITEAVTKGVRGKRPMKSSNIEWISEIPAEWQKCRIKNVISPQEKAIFEEDEIVTCFRDGEVTLRKNRREDGFTVSFTENGYHGVDIGDLVIHGMDAFAGAIGCSDSRGKTTPVVHVCHTKGNNRFFMYYLRMMAFGNILMDLSNGVRIRSSDFRNFSKLGVYGVCVPPVDEQNEIVTYLDTKCAEIDRIIDSKQKLLTELASYKKSLIYEYVTGKKVVVD